jgi:hypothetical protein
MASVQCTVSSVQKKLAQASDRKSNYECLSADFSGIEIYKVAANSDKNFIGWLGVREIKGLIKLKFFCRLPSKLIAQEASHQGGN